MTPLFISVERIKEISVVDSNVDAGLITPTIIMVQDLYLQAIIGTDLYKEIQEEIPDNVSDENKILLNDFIQNYLINMSIAEGLQNFHTKITNTDVVNQNSANANGADAGTIHNFKKMYKSLGENYGKQLSQYLCANASTYPLYQNGNQEAWKIKPKKFEFSSQIFTGNRRFDPRNRFKTWRK